MKKVIITALAALSVSGVANADVYVHGRSGDRNNPGYYNTTPANGATAKGAAAKYVSNRLTAPTVNTDGRYWSSQATFYGFASLDGTNAAGTKNYLNWDGVSEVITNSTVVNALRAGLPAGGNVTRTHSTAASSTRAS